MKELPLNRWAATWPRGSETHRFGRPSPTRVEGASSRTLNSGRSHPSLFTGFQTRLNHGWSRSLDPRTSRFYMVDRQNQKFGRKEHCHGARDTEPSGAPCTGRPRLTFVCDQRKLQIRSVFRVLMPISLYSSSMPVSKHPKEHLCHVGAETTKRCILSTKDFSD